MKKLIGFICMTIVFSSMSRTALAGSIPEDLLHSDNAQIFFGEVVAFKPDGEIPYVEVIPTKKIKGDVIVDGSCGTWQKANAMGNIDVKPGNVYLFTYFDENNPTDIFEVTSYDTSTLRLKNVSGDMWERFEKYLHEGRYEKAEHERLDRQNEQLKSGGKDISLVELLGVAKKDAENINIHYYGEVYEIDVDEFYKAIDGIMLTDIEDVSLKRENEEGFVIQNGMFITINGFDGYAFITDDCKVDKYGMHFSRLPIGAYTIKFIEREKITALFEADTYKSPQVFYAVVFAILLFAFVFIIGYVAKRKSKQKKA